MIAKRKLLICAVTVYVILVSLFIILLNEKTKQNDDMVVSYSYVDNDDECDFMNPCVRFCCNDKSTCNETFIHKNFNASILMHSLFDENQTRSLKLFMGHPECSITATRLTAKNIDFLLVS